MPGLLASRIYYLLCPCQLCQLPPGHQNSPGNRPTKCQITSLITDHMESLVLILVSPNLPPDQECWPELTNVLFYYLMDRWENNRTSHIYHDNLRPYLYLEEMTHFQQDLLGLCKSCLLQNDKTLNQIDAELEPGVSAGQPNQELTLYGSFNWLERKVSGLGEKLLRFPGQNNHFHPEVTLSNMVVSITSCDSKA